MKWLIGPLSLLAGCLFLTTVQAGEEWIAAPSFYTHDASGNRVAQHTPIGPFYVSAREDFQRSGYRHTRSSLQFGGSVDHFHIVEEWGRPVRPYDEWRFPYRPYSAPYEAWGPPLAGLGYPAPLFPFGWGWPPANGLPAAGNVPAVPNPPGAGIPGAGLPGAGLPGAGIPGVGNPLQPFVPYRGYQPWFDDRYPAVDDRAPWRHQPFPVVPQIP
ncbi:MAG: hypothetical protein AB7O38_06670 [Pirellulaceae bacterium]